MAEQKQDLFYKEMELIETRIRLNKLIQLNLLLYRGIMNYAKRNGIPTPIDATILRLAQEIEETDIESFPKNSSHPTKIHSKKLPDEDFTKPVETIYKGAIVFSEH